MWDPQIIEAPTVQVLAIPSLEAYNKYAELVLEVLLLRSTLRLAGSYVRFPNGSLPSVFCDSCPLAYSKQYTVESLPNAGISLKGGELKAVKHDLLPFPD